MTVRKVPLDTYSINDYRERGLLIDIDGVHEELKNILGTRTKCAGFYCFYNEEGYPLYLGQTTDLRGRIKQHLNYGINPMCYINNIVKFVRISPVDTNRCDSTLITHETELIKTVKPLFNGPKPGTKRIYYFENLREWLNDNATSLYRMPKEDADRVVNDKISNFVNSDRYNTEFIEDGNAAISENDTVTEFTEDDLSCILKAIKFVAKREADDVDDVLYGLIKVASKM